MQLYLKRILCLCLLLSVDIRILQATDTRAQICGDHVVGGVESCDDGNTENADGCSSSCTIEEGYMCFGSHRKEARTRGTQGVWLRDANTGLQFLNVTEDAETCMGSELCSVDWQAWNSTTWDKAYADMSMQHIVLAPSGFYCSLFCENTFVPPTHYAFRNGCTPTAVDECSHGLSTCSTSAYCIEPEDRVGYSCKCFDNFYVTALHGRGCQASGVQLEVFVAGTVNTDAGGSVDTALNRDNMVEARLKIVEMLFSEQYLTSASSVDMIMEGILDYDVEMVLDNIVDGTNIGRSLWRIILRAPMIHLDIAKLSAAGLAEDMSLWNSILNNTDKYTMTLAAAQCSNDRRVSCVGDEHCLGDGTCDANKPNVKMHMGAAGGSTSPLQAVSSGADVISVELDVLDSAFKIRIRYDDTVHNVMDTVYLSHVQAPVSNVEMATFLAQEFPCLPSGSDAAQQGRENSGTDSWAPYAYVGLLYYGPIGLWASKISNRPLGLKASNRGTGLWAPRPATGVQASWPQGLSQGHRPLGLKAPHRGTGLWASRPATGVKAFGPQGPEVVRAVIGVYRPKKFN